MKNSNLSLSRGKKPTVTFDQLCVSWLEYKTSFVKISTFARYTYIVNKYLIPVFTHQFLENITEEQLSSIIVRLKTCSNRQGKQLSDKTVSDILCILKNIWKYAKKNTSSKHQITDR